MIAVVLAQESFSRVEYLRSLERRFSQSEPDIGVKILVIVAVFVGTVLLFALLNRLQKRKSDPNIERPFRLFLKTMKCLRIPWRDRWRLWRVARALRLEHPTALLISPQAYDAALRDLARKPGLFGARPATRQALADLRLRIFAEVPAPDAAPAPTPGQ